MFFSKLKSWSIILYSQNKLNVDELDKSKILLKIPFESFGKFNPRFTQADPFLFVQNNTLYLFYEVQKYAGVGEIYMISTQDLQNWTKPQCVLKERCHLSYPFVFKEGEQVYMLPESSALKEVRLYRGNEGLTHFDCVKSLELPKIDIDADVFYIDSSISKIDGVYYLFTTLKNSKTGIYTLLLYHSKNLLGQFVEHPKSPIAQGKEFVRGGGSNIWIDGKLYRVAQNCVNDYGDNLSLIEIVSISKTEYEERIHKSNFINRLSAIYKEGSHHFNFVEFKGRYIISSDIKSYRYYLRRVWFDIYRHLKKHQ